jgi:hypothetical protein
LSASTSGRPLVAASLRGGEVNGVVADAFTIMMSSSTKAPARTAT